MLQVLVLHNHFPLACLGGVCKSYSVDTSAGHLQHYRADCVSTLKNSCDKEYKKVSVKADSIWRFKDRLIAASTEALKKLGFFKVNWQQGQTPAALSSSSTTSKPSKGKDPNSLDPAVP